MTTYLALMRCTKEGIEKIKESPSRLDAAKKATEAAGAKLVSFYLLMGQYDMAAIIEAPDDATYARFSLSLARKAVFAWKPSALLPRTNTGRSFQASPDLQGVVVQRSGWGEVEVCPEVEAYIRPDF